MADSQTTSATTAGPVLFTHDGYKLYVFDGEPHMLDKDVGERIGWKKTNQIRSLIKRKFAELEFFGLVRLVISPIPQGGRGKGRTKDGMVYSMNQEQVRWRIIQSRTPAGSLCSSSACAITRGTRSSVLMRE